MRFFALISFNQSQLPLFIWASISSEFWPDLKNALISFWTVFAASWQQKSALSDFMQFAKILLPLFRGQDVFIYVLFLC